jgi:hypothetical protein
VEQDKAYLASREAKKAVEGTVTEAAKNQEQKLIISHCRRRKEGCGSVQGAPITLGL